MKNLFNKLTLFFLGFVAIVAMASCDKPTEPSVEPTNGGNQPTKEVEYTGEIEFTDVIETPTDIPELDYLDYINYPAKPDSVVKGQVGDMPTIGTATTDSLYYKINQTDENITIKFKEVDRWDYVFLPISKFNSEYQNIKITATATNVQKLSIAAVYYEMYDANLPLVATHVGDVGDTEQVYIMELGKINTLDESYYPLEDTLGSKTVFGLCIFIDSNPSQSINYKDTTVESVFDITKIEFLKDGDESIKDKFVEPSLNVGWNDAGYTTVKNESTKEYTITKSASAAVWESASLEVRNYSSEYSAFDLKFTTKNVKNFTIELTVSGGLADWAENVLVYKATNITDGENDAYIDFSSTQPTSTATWAPVPGYYIKNYKIVGIKFYLDTADTTELNNQEATCVINEIKFNRMVAEDGTVVSKGWNAGSGNIVLGNDLAVGGVGTINYSWYNTWEYLTIPVLNYNTSTKLTIEFQANEGISYMGIGLGCASFPQGEAILKSCWDKVDVAAEKQDTLAGIVETVEYDATTKIYKITFDFTNAVKVESYNGKSVNEMQITSLRFYLTDPNSTDEFEGTRSIRFINISFE